MELSLKREIRVPVGDPKLAMLKIDKYLTIRVGDEAPDFAATTIGGEKIRLSELRGKVVLLDFWATWCGPCIVEMPNIKRALDSYGKDGKFLVIGVSIDYDESSVKRFLEKRGYGWTQIAPGLAEQNPVAQTYNVQSVPATFLIGPDGTVVAKDLHGAALDNELKKLLQPALVSGAPTTSGEK